MYIIGNLSKRLNELPARKVITEGLCDRAAKDSKKLLEETYDAVVRDCGLDEFRPELKITTEIPDPRGNIHMGQFDSKTITTSINDYLIKMRQTPQNLCQNYFNTMGYMFHETRHFLQDLYLTKESGFDTMVRKKINGVFLLFQNDALVQSLDKLFDRNFYEKAAASLPPLDEKQKELTSKMIKSEGYTKFDTMFGLTEKYKQDVREVDANEFAAAKLKEVIDSLASLPGRSGFSSKKSA